MHQFTKGKFLPIAITVFFVGTTIFFSSAAAQKIIHSAPSSSRQKKDILKTTKAISKDFLPVDNLQAGIDDQTEILDSLGQNQFSIQSARSGEAEVLNQANIQDKTDTDLGNNSQDNRDNDSKNNESQISQNSNSNNPSTVLANTFTPATLAIHNKSGDCYIAYKGKVYNLSNSVAWANCQHHGGKGGIDVTSAFPHSASYFDTLPMVGILELNNNQANIQSSQNQNIQNNQSQNTSPVLTGNTATSGTATLSKKTGSGLGANNQVKGLYKHNNYEDDSLEQGKETSKKSIRVKNGVKALEEEDED